VNYPRRTYTALTKFQVLQVLDPPKSPLKRGTLNYQVCSWASALRIGVQAQLQTLLIIGGVGNKPLGMFQRSPGVIMAGN
jgi:hypothetical protein